MATLAPSSVICALKRLRALCGSTTIDAVKRQREPLRNKSQIFHRVTYVRGKWNHTCKDHGSRTPCHPILFALDHSVAFAKFTCPECSHPRNTMYCHRNIIFLKHEMDISLFIFVFSCCTSDFYVLVSRTDKKNKFNLCTILHIGRATYVCTTLRAYTAQKHHNLLIIRKITIISSTQWKHNMALNGYQTPLHTFCNALTLYTYTRSAI